MNHELIFESRHHQTVVRAEAPHAAWALSPTCACGLSCTPLLETPKLALHVFHDGPPQTACWSLEYAAQVGGLEYAPELAVELLLTGPGLSA